MDGIVLTTRSGKGSPLTHNEVDNNFGALKTASEQLNSEKAAAAHSHSIADVTGLQSALDGKAPNANVSSGAAGLAPASGGGTVNFLRADGAWAAPPGGGGGVGTVTSVGMSVPTGLSIAGSPITGAGTLALSLTAGYVIPTQAVLDAKLGSDLATAITETKATPVGADQTIILDSAASWAPKLATISSLPGAGVSDGDKGSITVSGGGTAWTLNDAAVTNAKRANMAASTISGRASGAGTGAPTDLSAAQVRTILNVADGATANTGTVTSVGMSVPTGLSVSGGPVTGSGTLAVTLAGGYVIPTQAALDAKQGIASTVGTGLGTTGTVDLDLAALTGTIQTITATGNITFTTSNRVAGRAFELRIAAGGASRTLAWPAWVAFGAALPTTLASGKVLRVAISCTGTTEASIDAAAAESV